MPDELNVTVEARYEQQFQIGHLAFKPQLAGGENLFAFENRQIAVRLPDMPTTDARHPYSPQAAFISVRRAATNEPLEIDIGLIKLTILGIRFEIPAAAAAFPGMNSSLYNEAQQRDLDEKSDRLYFQAERAIEYWLRVVRWKTRFPLIGRVGGTSYQAHDGGSLINSSTGTRFYTPSVGRTVVWPRRHVLGQSEWEEIDATLKDGLEPPIWHDYLASAHLRMAADDILEAFLDLAVASEARIRTCLFAKLPQGMPKGFGDILRRTNMTDIMTKWDDLGLPNIAHFSHIKTLFHIRNTIMHSGKEERNGSSAFR
jgi:hypothetical protein